MPEEIKCPKCDSSNIKEKKQKVAVGSRRGPHDAEYPLEEDYHYFECLDCWCEFDESGPIEE